MHSTLAHSQWLHQRLDSIYAAARDNEQKIKRFQAFELSLMACTSLAELLRTLVFGQREHFCWDVVTLALFDSALDLRQSCEQKGSRPIACPGVIFLDTDDILRQVHDHSGTPRIEPFDAQRHRCLFPGLTTMPPTVTLLPLLRNKQVIGSYNIGCNRKTGLRPDTATDFLKHLAAVISVCLQTASYQEKLRSLGTTDALTGVRNRRYFDQRLPEEVARLSRGAGPLSCLFIDLDRFKVINDRYGHQAGDDVLCEAAQVIQKQLRTADVVARFGGEEFAILLPQTENVKAVEIAERIRLKVMEHRISIGDNTELQVTVSIGVASLHEADRFADIKTLSAQLIADADKAVYAAKSAGRNKVINGNQTTRQEAVRAYA